MVHSFIFTFAETFFRTIHSNILIKNYE